MVSTVTAGGGRRLGGDRHGSPDLHRLHVRAGVRDEGRTPAAGGDLQLVGGAGPGEEAGVRRREAPPPALAALSVNAASSRKGYGRRPCGGATAAVATATRAGCP